MIKCRLCGLSYNLLTESHMRSQHGISLLDYEVDYPDAPLSSEAYRQHLQERPRQDYGGFYSEERCEALKRGIREANPEGRKLSPEHLAALRQGHRDYYTNPEKWEEFSEQMRILNSGPRLNWTEEQSQERSRITKAVFEDPEVRQMHSRAVSLALSGKLFTGEHQQAISEALTQVYREGRGGFQHLTGAQMEVRNWRISEAQKKLWEDPVYKEAMVRAIREGRRLPSGLEVELEMYLNRYYPEEWIRNERLGHELVIIGGKVPDFVRTDDRKLVIEAFGGYGWIHTEEGAEEKILHYEKHGYKCLVLWWDEVREDLVVEKVREFIEV